MRKEIILATLLFSFTITACDNTARVVITNGARVSVLVKSTVEGKTSYITVEPGKTESVPGPAEDERVEIAVVPGDDYIAQVKSARNLLMDKLNKARQQASETAIEDIQDELHDLDSNLKIMSIPANNRRTCTVYFPSTEGCNPSGAAHVYIEAEATEPLYGFYLHCTNAPKSD